MRYLILGLLTFLPESLYAQVYQFRTMGQKCNPNYCLYDFEYGSAICLGEEEPGRWILITCSHGIHLGPGYVNEQHFVGLNDEQWHRVTVVKHHHKPKSRFDVAILVLQLDPSFDTDMIKSVELADSPPNLGDLLTYRGYPFPYGEQIAKYTTFESTVITQGTGNVDSLVTNGWVNSGGSGGSLTNAERKLVGMVYGALPAPGKLFPHFKLGKPKHEINATPVSDIRNYLLEVRGRLPTPTNSVTIKKYARSKTQDDPKIVETPKPKPIKTEETPKEDSKIKSIISGISGLKGQVDSLTTTIGTITTIAQVAGLSTGFGIPAGVGIWWLRRKWKNRKPKGPIFEEITDSAEALRNRTEQYTSGFSQEQIVQTVKEQLKPPEPPPVIELAESSVDPTPITTVQSEVCCQQETGPDKPIPFPRKLDEASQLLELGKLEGRSVVLDSLRGLFLDDEAQMMIESGVLDEASENVIKDLIKRINERVDEVAPMSTKV